MFFSRLAITGCLGHRWSAIQTDLGIVACFLQISPMSPLMDDPERQPLLPPQQQGVESPENTGNITTTVTNDDSPTTDTDTDARNSVLEKMPNLSTVLWYTIWLVAGIIVLVFFIKGFMDACDINVGLLSLMLHTVLTFLGSSISRRLSRAPSEAA
jgi:hypothetical protein